MSHPISLKQLSIVLNFDLLPSTPFSMGFFEPYGVEPFKFNFRPFNLELSQHKDK